MSLESNRGYSLFARPRHCGVVYRLTHRPRDCSGILEPNRAFRHPTKPHHQRFREACDMSRESSCSGTDIGYHLPNLVGFLSLLAMGQHYSERHWLTPILLEGGRWMKCALGLV
jgi:hypothetical protein